MPATHAIRARAPRGDASAVDIDSTAETIARYLEDAAHFPGGHADRVARPRTEAEIAALLTTCSCVLPIGAQSSVTGGATPAGGLVLSTERMVSVQESGHEHVRAGAGMSIQTLQKVLSARGRWYAPFPTFTGACVGGIVATNAAGAATFKYGTTRSWVDGLTMVLACGDVLDLRRGAVIAHPDRGFEITCAHGTRTIRPGRYRMPRVPKCSAGYFAGPDMDLIDLFIGSEGTLGVITEALLRVLAVRPSIAIAWVPASTEHAGFELVGALRDAARETWRTHDPAGLDIAAIEYLDRRCLEILREDGADARADVTIPADAELGLIVQIELPTAMTAGRAFDDIAGALRADSSDTPLTRFCRMLERYGLLEHAEMAMPGDIRRADQLLALREAAPVGVNRRVGEARRRTGDAIEKTAADMVVPFEHFAEMMNAYREGYARRGLDFAIWGHISDGNVHPNVIPRSLQDVAAGKDAILEFGRTAAELSGCPLAEHGVGRSALKQTLLREFYGEQAIDEMRAIKHVLDPENKLAPGVIFPLRDAPRPAPRQNRPAILLDMGNVLVFFDHHRACRQLSALATNGITPDRLFADIFQSGLEEDYDRGRLTTVQFVGRLRELLASTSSDEAIGRAWCDMFERNDDVTESLSEVKTHARLLMLASNTNELHFSWVKRHYPDVIGRFDAFTLSYEIGCRKPDPRFFESCIAQAGGDASNCFYVDDRAEYIDAAALLGIRGRTYSKGAKLMDILAGQRQSAKGQGFL